MVGQHDARHARNHERCEVRERTFAHPHRFEQARTRHNAQSRNDEREKEIARQRSDFLVFEKRGNQGRRRKKQGVERHTQRQGKPKHRIVIAVLHRRAVRQRRSETAFLNRRGNE